MRHTESIYIYYVKSKDQISSMVAVQLHVSATLFEPRREKTCLRGFRPGPTQTGLYKLRKELEA